MESLHCGKIVEKSTYSRQKRSNLQGKKTCAIIKSKGDLNFLFKERDSSV